MIWVVGDSHAFFFSKFDFCDAWTVGALLAYNFINRKDVHDKIRADVPKGSYLMFVLGEIDIRVHLISHRNVKEVVDRFIESLRQFKEDYKVIVWGAIGSSNDDFLDLRAEYPAVGSTKERNQIAKEFNDYLGIRCKLGNFIFLSIFDTLVDENGLTRSEYYCYDHVHLSDSALPLVEILLKGLPSLLENI